MDDLEHQDKGQDDVACDYPCFHLLKPFLIPMTPANRDTENKASEEQADEVCDLLQHCASSDPRVSLQSRLAFRLLSRSCMLGYSIVYCAPAPHEHHNAQETRRDLGHCEPYQQSLQRNECGGHSGHISRRRTQHSTLRTSAPATSQAGGHVPTTPKERLCYRLVPACQLLVTGLSQPVSFNDSLQPFLEVYQSFVATFVSHLHKPGTNS